jgi:hypothetical protein
MVEKLQAKQKELQSVQEKVEHLTLRSSEATAEKAEIAAKMLDSGGNIRTQGVPPAPPPANVQGFLAHFCGISHQIPGNMAQKIQGFLDEFINKTKQAFNDLSIDPNPNPNQGRISPATSSAGHSRAPGTPVGALLALGEDGASAPAGEKRDEKSTDVDVEFHNQAKESKKDRPA